jgi:hypothetical protein
MEAVDTGGPLRGWMPQQRRCDDDPIPLQIVFADPVAESVERWKNPEQRPQRAVGPAAHARRQHAQRNVWIVPEQRRHDSRAQRRTKRLVEIVLQRRAMLIAARSSQDFGCCFCAVARARSKYASTFVASRSADLNASSPGMRFAPPFPRGFHMAFLKGSSDLGFAQDAPREHYVDQAVAAMTVTKCCLSTAPLVLCFPSRTGCRQLEIDE